MGDQHEQRHDRHVRYRHVGHWRHPHGRRQSQQGPSMCGGAPPTSAGPRRPRHSPAPDGSGCGCRTTLGSTTSTDGPCHEPVASTYPSSCRGSERHARSTTVARQPARSPEGRRPDGRRARDRRGGRRAAAAWTPLAGRPGRSRSDPEPNLKLVGTDGWISLPPTPSIFSKSLGVTTHPGRATRLTGAATYIFGFRNVTGLTDADQFRPEEQGAAQRAAVLGARRRRSSGSS